MRARNILNLILWRNHGHGHSAVGQFQIACKTIVTASTIMTWSSFTLILQWTALLQPHQRLEWRQPVKMPDLWAEETVFWERQSNQWLSSTSISTVHQAATQQSTGRNRPWNAEHWTNGNVYKWASPLPNPFKHPTDSSSCLEMAEHGTSDVPRNPKTPAIADHTSCLPLHLVNSHAFRTSVGKTGKNCKRKELALEMNEHLLVRLTEQL